MYSSNLAQNHDAVQELNSLMTAHLEQKQELFQAVNSLISQLHHTKILLEENKPKEALLTVEQLVDYGETIAHRF
ncbi:MAG: hypothetical protein AB4058_16750 [Microcystaceae cyanobacterium]